MVLKITNKSNNLVILGKDLQLKSKDTLLLDGKDIMDFTMARIKSLSRMDVLDVKYQQDTPTKQSKKAKK